MTCLRDPDTRRAPPRYMERPFGGESLVRYGAGTVTDNVLVLDFAQPSVTVRTTV